MAQEDCSPDAPSSAACAALEGREKARLIVSDKLCARLFPDQAVFQAGCMRSCRSDTSGDGQSCAFDYSRSLRYAPQEQPSGHGAVWTLAGGGVIFVLAAVWAMRRRYRTREIH